MSIFDRPSKLPPRNNDLTRWLRDEERQAEAERRNQARHPEDRPADHSDPRCDAWDSSRKAKCMGKVIKKPHPKEHVGNIGQLYWHCETCGAYNVHPYYPNLTPAQRELEQHARWVEKRYRGSV